MKPSLQLLGSVFSPIRGWLLWGKSPLTREEVAGGSKHAPSVDACTALAPADTSALERHLGARCCSMVILKPLRSPVIWSYFPIGNARRLGCDSPRSSSWPTLEAQFQLWVSGLHSPGLFPVPHCFWSGPQLKEKFKDIKKLIIRMHL